MSRFSRKNFGNSHAYYVDGQKIPGVTSVIGVLDKPALVSWASETTARHAVENWPRLTGMSMIDRFEELKKARYAVNREATVRGKRIHALAEKLIKGESVSTDDQSLRAAAQVYADLLDTWSLEQVLSEASVVSYGYQYAGTLDGIFESPRVGRVIVDVKTGKRAYSEVALQLAAYRYCDDYLEEVEQRGPRGGRLPSTWEAQPMPQVDGAVVIHIERETEDSPAAARLLPVAAGEREWSVFLWLNEIYREWIERTGFDHRKQPTYSPPIGAELHPEMSDTEIREALQ
jgi:hypothetical protein